MYIELNFVWIVTIVVGLALLFLVKEVIYKFLSNKTLKLHIDKDIHFKDKDTSITSSLIDKFPLVSPEFMNKSAKEQTLENNQEIQEILKKLEEMQNRQNQAEDAIRTFAKIAKELRERG